MPGEPNSDSRIERVYQNPLQSFVQWTGAGLAPRCPRWLAPETIALSGFAFALLAAAALPLAAGHKLWFIPAAFGIAMQQVADWLDGAVARFRGLTSDHGALLDVVLDDLSFTVMFLGLACAGYATFEVIVLALIVYLLNDIVVNLRIHFLRQHLFSFVSPAEISALGIVACALTFFFPQPLISVGARSLGWFDMLALGGTAYGVIELFVSVRRLYVELIRAGR